MRTLLQDIRFGGRMLRKNPGFAFIIVLTLALAIAANTVIFSFTNLLVVRPLPIRDPAALGWIYTIDPQRGNDRGANSLPDFLDYRASVRSFQSLALSSQATLTMTGRGDAVRLTANRVTANLFDTWGIPVVSGRGFLPGEDAPGAMPVVVLSHKAWMRQFAGDRSIVSQTLMLNGQSHTVVGVLSPVIEFGNLSLIDVWVPLTLDPGAPRDRRIYRMTGRLAPGVSVAQADAEVREVSRRLERDHPQTNRGWVARVVTSRESMTSRDTPVILALLTTVVGFVLLIACANIANLVLARATGRRRELAIRTALGASRVRMVRQLLTESILLGIMGGAVGLALADLGLVAIKAAAFEPFFDLVNIDRNVLIFTGVLAFVTPLLFSVIPAIQSTRSDVNDALKEGTARAGGGASGRRSRAVLVVSQLSLAMALLIVSGLLIRSMIALAQAPLGFETRGLITLQLDIPDWRYRTDAAIREYYDRLLMRLAQIPGVTGAAAVDRRPVLSAEIVENLDIEGHAPAGPDDRPWSVIYTATDAFFSTTGIPLIAGRGFTSRDSADAMPVAIVNAHMARKYWGDPRRALGRHVTLAGTASGRRTLEVIGVVGDVKKPDLRGVNPQLYVHAAQAPKRAMGILIRAAEPDSVMPAVRSEVRAADADVPVYQLRTVDGQLNDELSSTRILIGMLVSFAVLALFIAAAGLYGVISYSVSQRVQEIGIRMALGAVPQDIRRLVARETAILVAIGAVLGIAGGAAIARAAASVLVSVSPSDPATYGTVAIVLTSIAILAAYAPVRRATRIDPLTALRTE
jgi:putative ABC transport system permease protein